MNKLLTSLAGAAVIGGAAYMIMDSAVVLPPSSKRLVGTLTFPARPERVKIEIYSVANLTFTNLLYRAPNTNYVNTTNELEMYPTFTYSGQVLEFSLVNAGTNDVCIWSKKEIADEWDAAITSTVTTATGFCLTPAMTNFVTPANDAMIFFRGQLGVWVTNVLQ